MITLQISATTTTDAIQDAIPYLDMRTEAIERRDDAAAVLESQGDQTVLELHNVDGIDVLFSPVFCYAYVNQRSAGTGNSMLIPNGEADNPEHAARQWKTEA